MSFSAYRATRSPPGVSLKDRPLKCAVGVPRTSKRRRLHRIVNTAQDDRLVRIAFQEVNDHLIADARDRDRTEAPARPGLGDADPARAIGVLLSLSVPVKLHL